jgi:DNA-binding beta-propeller fold protein YncE
VTHFENEDGNLAPTRQLMGSNTLIASPTAIAADLANDEIYVVNRVTQGTVTVYARTTADGDTPPLRRITGLVSPAGVAVDPTNNEVYVTDLGESSVIVFPRSWTGTTPARNRTLTSTGTLVSPVSVTLDFANGEMFIADDVMPFAIDVFNMNDAGDRMPKRALTGTGTALNRPSAVAIGGAEMFVANFNNSSITVYARTASGATPPKRNAIMGTSTGLAGPSGLAIDLTPGLLLVSNYNGAGQGSILTFATSDVGNSPPQRSIVGAKTGLLGSYGVVICH